MFFFSRGVDCPRHLYLVVTELIDNVRIRLGVPFYFVCAQVHSTLGRPPGRHGWRRTLAAFRKHSVFGVHLRPVHRLQLKHIIMTYNHDENCILLFKQLLKFWAKKKIRQVKAERMYRDSMLNKQNLRKLEIFFWFDLILVYVIDSENKYLNTPWSLSIFPFFRVELISRTLV